MWIGSQLVVPKTDKETVSSILKYITYAKNTINLNALIIWPIKEKDALNRIIDKTKELGITTYLWYPVLSDSPYLNSIKFSPIELFNGQKGFGIYGKWSGSGYEKENFLFSCPNNKDVIDKIFDNYIEEIENGDFDGVFLDRIRYPSPVNGLEVFFSCFCPHWKSKFYEEYNKDIDSYREKAKKVFYKLKENGNNYIGNMTDFSNFILEEGLHDFVEFRYKSIYELVKKFANFAKNNNKIVGLDLFAPLLSFLVGQDYTLLSSISDWIKPMLYCHTNAPAGIPVEIYSFIKGLKEADPLLKKGEIRVFVKKFLGIDINIEQILENGLDESMILSELKKLDQFGILRDIDVYPGIEGVRIPQLVNISTDILEKYLYYLRKANIDGMVLSWNLIDIPFENLSFLGNALNNLKENSFG